MYTTTQTTSGSVEISKYYAYWYASNECPGQKKDDSDDDSSDDDEIVEGLNELALIEETG